MATYVAAIDAVTGNRVVIQIDPGPGYTVIAACGDSVSRATQIAALLTEADA